MSSEPRSSDDADTQSLPPDLRFLKALVTTLAGVMIVGLLLVIGLLVTRLLQRPPLPALPASVVLPEGAAPVAVTFAHNWLVVVSEDGRVMLYRPEGGAPVSVTPLP